MDVRLAIVGVHPDPRCGERLHKGSFRINRELNEEWIDIQNQGPHTLNLQGRVLACCRRKAELSVLRKAMLRSQHPIALYPGEKIRIFSGEQPPFSTHIPDEDRVQRVLWMVQPTYIWLPEGNEAHLYFSQQDLRQQRPPLAKYRF